MTIHFDEDKQKQRLRTLRADEEEKSVQNIADKYGLPYIDLTRVPINTDGLRLIPETESRVNRVIVFDIIGKKISIALHSPGDQDTVESIKKLQQKGYETSVFLSSMNSIEKAWDRYKDLSFAFETEAGSLDISNDEIEQLIEQTKKLADVSVLVEEALATKRSHKVSRLIAVVMAGALSTKASDIHVESENDHALIRYRLDGVLIEVVKFDLETYRLLLSRIKLLSGLKLNIKESAQDGRFTVKIYMSDIEIRTSTVPSAYGESIVMRILNPTSITTSIDELGFPDRLMKILMIEIARPNGLILTTGPTGSGKTTTLYSFLRKLLTPEMKIITIEDPIEYHLPGVVQTQVEDRKGYGFESGLRAALRQDPDVIMVGEIRDGETANTAIQAALTGHLVLSTLHTNNAAGTFTRLVDLGVDSKVITSALRIAIAQRLVRKLCLECRKRMPIPQEKLKYVDELLSSLKGFEELSQFVEKPKDMWVSVGCERCNNTGYKGRLGVYEAIMSDNNIEYIIRENPGEREIKKAATAQKIVNMKQDGLIKVFKGITSFDELERVVDLAEELLIPEDDVVSENDIVPEKIEDVRENVDVKSDEEKINIDETYTTTNGDVNIDKNLQEKEEGLDKPLNIPGV